MHEKMCGVRYVSVCKDCIIRPAYERPVYRYIYSQCTKPTIHAQRLSFYGFNNMILLLNMPRDSYFMHLGDLVNL